MCVNPYRVKGRGYFSQRIHTLHMHPLDRKKRMQSVDASLVTFTGCLLSKCLQTFGVFVFRLPVCVRGLRVRQGSTLQPLFLNVICFYYRLGSSCSPMCHSAPVWVCLHPNASSIVLQLHSGHFCNSPNTETRLESIHPKIWDVPGHNTAVSLV